MSYIEILLTIYVILHFGFLYLQIKARKLAMSLNETKEHYMSEIKTLRFNIEQRAAEAEYYKSLYLKLSKPPTAVVDTDGAKE